MLLIRAKNGARGKAATKMVTKPYWITEIYEGSLEIMVLEGRQQQIWLPDHTGSLKFMKVHFE